ncbi:MAG: cell division protein ZapA [Atopostipes suicloacalis]|nr:cell division protein ZapA [Atopostipes suicloacalis]
MSAEKKRVKVVIDGKEYTIIGSKSAAHVQLVAKTVNEQLKQLNELSTKLSKEEQSILIAVNAVSDQIDSHKKMMELENKIINNNKD